MKTITFIQIIRGAAMSLFLLYSTCGQSQNNPWNAEVTGDNPWGQESTSSELTASDYYVDNYAQDIDSVLKALNLKMTTDSSLNASEIEQAKTFVVNASNDSVAYFNVSDSILKLKTQDHHYVRELRKHGMNAYYAGGALFIGMASGTLVNVLALPFNLVASVIPTKKSRALVQHFQANNPHATVKEVKAYKSGITRKRLTNATVGVVCGTGANLYLIVISGLISPGANT